MKKIAFISALVIMTVSCQNNQENSSETNQYEISEPENVFEVPETFGTTTLTFKVNPNADTILNVGQYGTKLYIPSNAFISQKGDLITSTVTINFQEYKNSAEMAFSRIPMTYEKGGEEFFFNSSGMFYIQGYANNEQIEIAENKSLTIDYFLAKQNLNIDFYRMQDDSSNWELVNEIQELPKPKINVSADSAIVQEFAVEEVAFIGEGDIAEDTFVMEDNGNRTNATLLAEGADAGHTYPDIVKGLNISSFGVYNCDQIYRLPNRVNIIAKYEDENGAKIKSPKILSLIDLNYNGAFSFAPNNFTCDSKGENVLLLFAESGELFLLEKGEFEKMNITENGEYLFKMKNVSSTISSTEDLASYLGIKM